jgi:hypothetical protein
MLNFPTKHHLHLVLLALPTLSLIRADNVVDAPICKLAVGVTTQHQFYQLFEHLHLGYQQVLKMFLANKTPPKFIELVVADGKLMFVPIIILFEPIDDKTSALPTL